MKKKNKKISDAVIRRLPRYRRYLGELKKDGVEKISSNDFSRIIGYTASQIRQDLNNFGDFGQPGYGYSVDGLYDEISRILGLDKNYKIALVGAGNLGQAIAKYVISFNAEFTIVSAFEVNEQMIGKSLGGVLIRSYDELEDYVRDNQVDIGVICVNWGNAQEVADKLSSAGIKGIWNFALVDLDVPDGIALESAHLSDTLHALAYHMNDPRVIVGKE